MLNELTTQQFFEIIAEIQGEICAASILAGIVGTYLYWLSCDVLKSVFIKFFGCKKGRAENEKE